MKSFAIDCAIIGCGVALLFALQHCSGAQVGACELNALRVLPLDNPDAISVGDTRELVRNLKSCRSIVREFPGDAGQ